MPSTLTHPAVGPAVKGSVIQVPKVVRPRVRAEPPPSAHDRLKASFGSLLGGSIALSALAHYLFLSFASFNAIPDYGIHAGPPMEQLALEREYQIPPPPEPIARPAIPVLSANANIDTEITIGSVLLRDNPADAMPMPAPPVPDAPDIAAQPTFTPYEVRPELKNGAEIQRVLERSYLRLLKDAGIGGVTVLWVFIDATGTVKNTKVTQSSEYGELDEVAQQVMLSTARFSPAVNRDQRVPVWIQIPVTFQTRNLPQ